MKYKDLFIDFDDTLYDTHGYAVIALSETFEAFRLGRYFQDPQVFYDAYWTANIDLWTQYATAPSMPVSMPYSLIAGRFLKKKSRRLPHLSWTACVTSRIYYNQFCICVQNSPEPKAIRDFLQSTPNDAFFYVTPSPQATESMPQRRTLWTSVITYRPTVLLPSHQFIKTKGNRYSHQHNYTCLSIDGGTT